MTRIQKAENVAGVIDENDMYLVREFNENEQDWLKELSQGNSCIKQELSHPILKKLTRLDHHRIKASPGYHVQL